MKSITTSIIQRKYSLGLIILIVVALYVFSQLAIQRHLSLSSYYFDLGIMHQVAHNTSQGRILEMTHPNTYVQTGRLGLHFDAIIALFAPFYLIWDSAIVLLLGQTLFLVSGAIPLYKLARKVHKKRAIALLFAGVYFLNFPLQWTNLFDFHAITLTTSLLLWAFYFADEKKYRLSFAVILLSWFAKENVSLVTGFMGLYFYFIKREKRFGKVLAISSFLVFGFVYSFAMPFFRSGEHFAAQYYTTDLGENFSRIFSGETVAYLGKLFSPVAFLSFFSPLQLFIAVPQFMIVLLSSNPNMRLLQYHYSAMLTPFIMISAVYGLRNVITLIQSRFSISAFQARNWLLTILLGASVFTSYIYGPFPKSNFTVNQKQLAVVYEWQHILKDDSIPVAASGHLAPHFSNRQYFYNFLFDFAYGTQGYSDTDIFELANHYEVADYVLIKKSEVETDNELVNIYYGHLLKNPLFVKIFDEEGIEVYRRIALTQ